VKNGLIPIRNVVSHLAQMARERPAEMPAVFLERQATLESSVRYLQSLATNYARLSPTVEKRACDLNAIARDVVADALAGGDKETRSLQVVTQLADGLPRVLADPVALRRILENLVVNAVDSMEGRAGRVLVWTRLDETGGIQRFLIGVEDNGRGLTPTERAHIFDDFYSTKPGGTGLGLSIVRRLVADLGGRIDVESVSGEGTRFTIELVGSETRAVGTERPA
jgi:signal transduction histidine kinase